MAYLRAVLGSSVYGETDEKKEEVGLAASLRSRQVELGDGGRVIGRGGREAREEERRVTDARAAVRHEEATRAADGGFVS